MAKQLKRTVSLLLTGAMMVSLLVLPAEAAETTVQQIVPCQYDMAGDFSEGLGRVRMGDTQSGKWGYVDKTGKLVVPCQYEGVQDFSEGLATVKDSTGKCGVIDQTGAIIIPCQYDAIYQFHEGLAVIENNNMIGVIDKTGKVIVPLGRYFWPTGFSEGLMSVTNENGVGYIDVTGKEVIPCDGKYLGPTGGVFSEGLAYVRNRNGKLGYIDKTGKEIISFQYDGAGRFTNGVAEVYVGESPNAIKYGLVDSTGREVISCQYDALSFSEGLAVVRVGNFETGKYGVIDKTGKEIVPLGKYDYIAKFSDGCAAVRVGDIQTGKYGFIDRSGKLIVPCQYTRATDFSEGFAMVANSEFKWGYIDSTGREIVPFRYEYGYPFSNGMARVEGSNGKYGYVDKTGKEVISCQYNDAGNFLDGVARVENSNGKWGYLAIVDTDTPSQSEPQPTPTVGGFKDVKSTDYFADAVAWAVSQKITAGTSADTFSPNSTCTTAQILTFLWRAKGSPEPTSKTNTFTDIKESDYFYKAALWAKENNIISKDSTVFNGNTPCTRSMAVLYIWRSAGFPAAEKTSSFTDVAATTLYAPAVDWAVEAGVTSGTSATTFSPDTTCTRAQIVTFLYRAFA